MTIRFVFLGAALVAGSVVGAAPTPQDASGHWVGKLQMQNVELGMAVDLARDAQGKWIGSMNLEGASAIDVPLRALQVAGTTVQFRADLPDSAVFEGSLAENDDRLSGKASNASGSVPFQLTRLGTAKVSVPPPSSLLPKEFAGVWEAVIGTDGEAHRIRLKLSPAVDGLATAVLTSPDQGNTEIPVTSVTIEGQQCRSRHVPYRESTA